MQLPDVPEGSEVVEFGNGHILLRGKKPDYLRVKEGEDLEQVGKAYHWWFSQIHTGIQLLLNDPVQQDCLAEPQWNRLYPALTKWEVTYWRQDEAPGLASLPQREG